MGEELLGGFAVADEVVVDEVDGAYGTAGDDLVELFEDLGGGFEAGVLAVELGDVTELAAVGAAGRVLDVGEEVVGHLRPGVGGSGELGERKTGGGGEDLLGGGTVDGVGETGDESVRGVAELADVEEVKGGVELLAAGDAGTAEDGDFAEGVGAVVDGVDGVALDVHAGDEDGVCPAIVAGGGGLDVFVDEADFPMLRQVGGDGEDALGRHEGLDAEEGVGVVKGAEGGSVAGEDAEDAAGDGGDGGVSGERAGGFSDLEEGRVGGHGGGDSGRGRRALWLF